MRIPFAQPFAAMARNPHRPAAFLVGVLVPLVISGLFLVPRVGGLSDKPNDSRPAAYIIPTE
jgi:hypothetical protein